MKCGVNNNGYGYDKWAISNGANNVKEKDNFESRKVEQLFS